MFLLLRLYIFLYFIMIHKNYGVRQHSFTSTNNQVSRSQISRLASRFSVLNEIFDLSYLPPVSIEVSHITIIEYGTKMTQLPPHNGLDRIEVSLRPSVNYRTGERYAHHVGLEFFRHPFSTPTSSHQPAISLIRLSAPITIVRRPLCFLTSPSHYLHPWL